jgi:CheY-like chemotaxis protein
VLAAEGSRAVLRVLDNGIGLAPEHVRVVFDMFVQLDSSRTAATGGLGLGLTLVRSIVEQHGGEVEARSDGPGKGAQFIVRLPLAAAPAAEAPSASVRASARSRRILVVDDNADAARTLATLLAFDGHQAEAVFDGAEAVAAAERLRPEVLFIDLNMPALDGYELAKRLRALPWGRAATLVALTGMGQQSDIELARAAGFDIHLTKPADPERVSRIAAGSDGGANVLRFG